MLITFGERLMLFRKRAHLSQKKLADMAGVSVSTISKFENDLLTPSVEIMGDLAYCLNVSINQLYTGFEDPKKSMNRGLLKH